ALVDDPLLTVRRVAGPHPARVVIDPNGRLPAAARAFRDDGVRRLVITAKGAGARPPAGIEHIELQCAQGRLDPCDILRSLAARGLGRILIEGGPATVARFLEARCLDRLHVVVAPIILGGGRSSLDLAPITRCEEALRPHTVTHVLGNEVLFDCDLSAQRRPVGIAKKSTGPNRICGRPAATGARRSWSHPSRIEGSTPISPAALAQPASISIWISRSSLPRRQSEGPSRTANPASRNRSAALCAASGPSAGPNPLSVRWWRLTAAI